MSDITRRAALALLGSAPVAATMSWTPAEAQQAHEHAAKSLATTAQTGASFKPKFFTAHEYTTVKILADLIIPRDERSGSATDAGVPQFMDFMMIDDPQRRTAMRGGLAAIDHECNVRFERSFVASTDAQRRELLDDIAFTDDPPDPLSHLVAFFNSFRDLTASGFWTTKMGIADLQYTGNVFVDEWNGCPPAALEKLGVKY